MFDHPVLHPSRHQQHDTSQYYILITEGNILNAAKDATEQIEKAATPTKGSFFFQVTAKHNPDIQVVHTLFNSLNRNVVITR